MWKYLLFAVLIFFVVKDVRQWALGRKQSEVMQKALQQGGNLAELGVPNSCKEKQYCVTVFIAPWCGVCTSTEPTFHAFHNFLPKLRPNTGFGLVIGADSAASHAQKRTELMPIESITDDSGKIMQTRRIEAFPTWIVHDQSGKEVFRRAGGFSATTEEEISQVLTQLLKI